MSPRPERRRVLRRSAENKTPAQSSKTPEKNASVAFARSLCPRRRSLPVSSRSRVSSKFAMTAASFGITSAKPGCATSAPRKMIPRSETEKRTPRPPCVMRRLWLSRTPRCTAARKGVVETTASVAARITGRTEIRSCFCWMSAWVTAPAT
jgi:hypothetical protein